MFFYYYNDKILGKNDLNKIYTALHIIRRKREKSWEGNNKEERALLLNRCS